MRALRSGWLRSPVWAELLVFAVAFVPRIEYPLHSKPGLKGALGYDPGVYYAAADALIHGRLPYHDYVLLHPPGITLVVAPFAWLGELTTDHRGFVIANLAFCVLGAVNAALVVRVARRLGFGLGPAVIGGLAYAVWFGSVNAEYSIRLEPLGNFLLLLGLLAYANAQRTEPRRWPVLCGVAIGAATAVKIWWVVPLVLVAVWLVPRARRHQLRGYLAGAAGAITVICLPFFVADPREMWRMVIVYQVGRPAFASEPHRLPGMTSLTLLKPGFATRHDVLIVALAIVFVIAICGAALRVANGPLVAALLLVTAALLAVSPSWFSFYNDFAAPGLGLTIAAASAAAVRAVAPRIERPAARWSLRGATSAVVAGLTALLVGAAILLPSRLVYPYPSARLAAAVKHTKCVMSDSPMALIMLDVLSRDLADGCQNWVDVTGRTYGGRDATKRLPDGTWQPRADDPEWQADLTAYLFSGDAVTLLRVANTGIGPKLWHKLRQQRVLARVDKIVVYATRPAAGSH